MGKSNKPEQVMVTPVVEQQTSENTEQKKSLTYVVIREGFRVSDKEYEDPQDPIAIAEKEYWKKIAKTHSHNELVEIVKYDAKKHRVW